MNLNSPKGVKDSDRTLRRKIHTNSTFTLLSANNNDYRSGHWVILDQKNQDGTPKHSWVGQITNNGSHEGSDTGWAVSVVCVYKDSKDSFRSVDEVGDRFTSENISVTIVSPDNSTSNSVSLMLLVTEV